MSVRLPRLVLVGCAAVMAIMPLPLKAATEMVLYAFTSFKDGKEPSQDLTYAFGRFFGTTSAGGSHSSGTLYALSKAGRHRILHEFKGGSDGAYPYSSMLNVSGTLFGIAAGGGAACGCGTVFSLTPSGIYTQLYAFAGGSDGAGPEGNLVELGGRIYGTTEAGGGACNCGTVFSITPQGAEAVVYRFQGGADGSKPTGVITDGSMLFGTTSAGGNTLCSANGCGTIFRVAPDGAETVLHVFSDPAQGIVPAGRLLLRGNTLYGTTTHSAADACGDAGCGTVFSMSMQGAFKTLHAFTLTDGAYPQAGLIDVNGTFYGTAAGGGSGSRGVVFAMTPQGAVSVMHDFKGPPDGSDPYGDLISVQGTFYGTTQIGGTVKQTCLARGCGVIFTVTP